MPDGLPPPVLADTPPLLALPPPSSVPSGNIIEPPPPPPQMLAGVPAALPLPPPPPDLQFPPQLPQGVAPPTMPPLLSLPPPSSIPTAPIIPPPAESDVPDVGFQPAEPEQIDPAAVPPAPTTVQEALAIDDPARQVQALQELADAGDAGARIALDAQQAADVQARAAGETVAAREEYDKAMAAERERVAGEQATQAEALTRARGVLDQRQAELREISSKGQPALSGRDFAGLALQAVGQWIATGGRQPIDITANVDRVLAQKAQEHAQRVAAGREGVAEARLDVETAGTAGQQLQRDTALIQADLYKQFGDRLAMMRDRAQSEQAQLQLDSASKVAYQKALNLAGKAAQDEQTRQLDLTAKGADIEKTAAEIELLRAKTGKEAAAAAKLARRGTGGRKAPDARFAEAQLRAMSPKQQAQLRQTGLRDTAGDFLVNPDGSFVRVDDPKLKTKLSSRLAGARTINNLLIRLEGMRRKYGTEFKMSNSEALQDMQGTLRELQIAVKEEANLGALSGSDMDMVEDITGADAAGWFSNLSRWGAMRERLENKLNNDLRANTSFKGRFELPAGTPIKQLKPEQYRAQWSKPYSAKTGVPDPESLFAAVKQEQDALKRRFGGATAPEYIMLAQSSIRQFVGDKNLAADRKAGIPRAPTGYEKLAARIATDLKKARKRGDKSSIARLNKGKKNLDAFARRLRIERTRLGKQAGEKEARKRGAAERDIARKQSGIAPSGARPGQ